eukprot:1807696-Amphidinium_carterae.1
MRSGGDQDHVVNVFADFNMPASTLLGAYQESMQTAQRNHVAMRLNLSSISPPAQPGGQSHKSGHSMGQYHPSSEASSSPASHARTEIA